MSLNTSVPFSDSMTAAAPATAGLASSYPQPDIQRRTLFFPGALAALGRWLQRLSRMQLLPAKSRRLRVSEMVSLGDKRFVSIVQVDGVDYLVGVGTTNVSLLTRLESRSVPSPSFEQAVTTAWQESDVA